MQLGALLRLGFPSAPYLKYLTSLHTVTRWLVLQKARHHTHKVLWPVVGARFQVLFHSPSGVLFTFPSRYCFTIGHQVVFSLGRWSSLLPTRFHVSRGTLDRSEVWNPFAYGTITLCGPAFQLCSAWFPLFLWTVRNPGGQVPRFGLFPFRSPLLGKSIFLSLPPGNKMFQFPGFVLRTLCIHVRILGVTPVSCLIR